MKKTIHVLGLVGLISLSLGSCRTYGLSIKGSMKSCPAYVESKTENERNSHNQNYEYQSHTSQTYFVGFLYTDERGLNK